MQLCKFLSNRSFWTNRAVLGKSGILENFGKSADPEHLCHFHFSVQKIRTRLSKKVQKCKNDRFDRIVQNGRFWQNCPKWPIWQNWPKWPKLTKVTKLSKMTKLHKMADFDKTRRNGKFDQTRQNGQFDRNPLKWLIWQKLSYFSLFFINQLVRTAISLFVQFCDYAYGRGCY